MFVKLRWYSLSIFVALFALPAPAYAQQQVDLRDNATQILRALPPIDFSKFGTGSLDEKRMLDLVAKALGLEPGRGEKLSYLHKNKVPLTGMTSYRLEQRYQGIPVWGEQITITTSKNRPHRMGGKAIRALAAANVTGKASLSAAKALAIARKRAGVRKSPTNSLFNEDSSRLVVYFDEKRGKPVLAYEVRLFALVNNQPTLPVYMIDAQNGEVLLKYDNLQHLKSSYINGSGPGGNGKRGCYNYGQGDVPFLQIKRLKNNICSLESANVSTYNCHHTTGSNCTLQTFPCSTHTPQKVNEGCAPGNDAHFFGQVIFGMYRNWYSTRPIKQRLKMVVHYGKGLENAYWTGKVMILGDGGPNTYPLVSLDVTSHEIGHGFTRQHSALIYKGQSGGINEAFSDMAGEAAEAYFSELYKRNADTGMAVAMAMPSTSQGAGEQDINGLLTGSPTGETSREGFSLTGRNNPYDSGDRSSELPDELDINALLREVRPSPARRTPDHYASLDDNTKNKQKHTTPIYARTLPDFRIGADILRKEGAALRYLNNPPQDGKSIASAIKYYDGMDVHHSSGIYNKAFYLLANKPGWDTRKAFAVFLVANAAYWTPRENFLSAALKTIDAAKDLKYNVEDIKDVFRAVDIFVNP